MDRLRRVVLYLGTRDILVHDARRLRDRIRQAGAQVDFEEYPGMPHDWMLMPVPKARRQLAHLVAQLATVPVNG